jgi:hypothetical protein
MVRTAMKYIYTGDSTAVKAFETHEGNDELSQLVNLGKLFEIYTSYKMFDLSSYGKPNNWLARSVRESNVGRIPVFWLYTDPLQKQFWIDEQRFFPNIPEENKNKLWELITADDWQQKYIQMADAELRELNQLNIPIGLVGGSGDIEPNQVKDYKNITVIASSWKHVIGKHAGIPFNGRYMLVELLHNTVNEFFTHPDYKWNELWRVDIEWYRQHKELNQQLINRIYEIYQWRSDMMQAGYMTGVHPNVYGNVIYHNHIKARLKEWIDANT